MTRAWKNPLRDPRDKRLPRIAGPSSLVIFGVTGDLARKKLMPAIYDLANRGLLPPGFALTGFARRDWAHEDFAQVVYEAVKQHARTPFRQEVWDRLAEGIRFVQGTFDDDDAFDRLSDTVRELDEVRGTGGNHAFYLSIPPGEPDEREAWRQQTPVRQVVHRRHQFLAGQVAGHPEDDQPTGSGDPGQSLVLRVAQRVRPALRPAWHGRFTHRAMPSW